MTTWARRASPNPPPPADVQTLGAIDVAPWHTNSCAEDCITCVSLMDKGCATCAVEGIRQHPSDTPDGYCTCRWCARRTRQEWLQQIVDEDRPCVRLPPWLGGSVAPRLGTYNAYGGEGPHHGPSRWWNQCSIRYGNSIWREFVAAAHLDDAPVDLLALFDKHDVVDTLSFHEACAVGLGFDYEEAIAPILCSYGRRYRLETFDRTQPWAPMVAECQGHIFTDFPEGWHRSVDVYREPWMPPSCIGFRGDKGQVARLIGLPTLLFDDKEEVIDLLRRRSTPEIPLDGIVVRRGRKLDWGVAPGYRIANDPDTWLAICQEYRALAKRSFRKRSFRSL